MPLRVPVMRVVGVSMASGIARLLQASAEVVDDSADASEGAVALRHGLFVGEHHDCAQALLDELFDRHNQRDEADRVECTSAAEEGVARRPRTLLGWQDRGYRF